MFEQRSLKATLQYSIVVFTLLLALCFMLLMLSYAWIVEDNVFNRLVLSEAQFIQQQFQNTGDIVNPRHPFMTLYPGWQALPEQVQQLHLLSPQRIEFPNGKDGTLHLQALALGPHEWVLAADVSGFEVTRDYLPKLMPWLGLALALIWLLAFALSRYLSQKVIRPLEHISASVKHHNPGQPLILSDTLPDNEIGYLGRTIQNNIRQLQTALARESDFTRDISHELRTPATVLKMVLSRLSPSQPLDNDSLTQLRQSALQMAQTLHVLLALAREESMQKERLCLLEEIEHCLVNNPQLTQQPQLALELQVPANYQIQANRNLLHILLGNIINNALTHASTSQLHIRLTDDTLIIANPVAGATPTDLLTAGVKSASSPGIGQGMHIVKRICQVYQWQVTSLNKEDWFYLNIDFCTDIGPTSGQTADP
ncbi:HAMP domain-containing histidine kinase [Bowmanella sp. Y26]|uniref:sensor histidine kinase n=1 Tax=Bowmanella yangjiangensis TaxID=2811230 RepID=UPI001BDD0DA4|nr:HAMP domain-containing sensor histidine kinase [Bowmanella yangjiangensis]MBT1064375.1 HAMP domain-containing histidine kinase [Bowmanella yangjiangensis]